jgi:predicted kinase
VPALVVITGPPASGKSSAARAIAAELEIPFISKDELKERMYEVFGPSDDGEHEARVERAALGILFSVVESNLRAGVSVVAESNFHADEDVEAIAQLAGSARAHIVQVYFGGDPEELEERFAERAESGDRHPGHGDTPEKAHEVRAKIEAGYWRPLALPGDLLRATHDESDEAVAARVRAALE